MLREKVQSLEERLKNLENHLVCARLEKIHDFKLDQKIHA